MKKLKFTIILLLLAASSYAVTCSCSKKIPLFLGGGGYVTIVSVYESNTHCGDRSGVETGGVLVNYPGYGEFYVASSSGGDAYDTCN